MVSKIQAIKRLKVNKEMSATDRCSRAHSKQGTWKLLLHCGNVYFMKHIHFHPAYVTLLQGTYLL